MPVNNSSKSTPPTIITLTMPSPSSGIVALEGAMVTLLIQRGELAHVRQFAYSTTEDMAIAIGEASVALAVIEADPPVITEAPTEPPTPKKSAKPTPSEPTVDVPLKKGTKAVRISHIKITGGETDAAAYRQAVLLAGKLIDGKLWDGETPIQFDDVYRVAKKMKFLTAADFSLFKLKDFVDTCEQNAADSELPQVEAAPDTLL